MPRKTTSQWDFGELFPAAQTRRILTVSEFTAQVKRLLETQMGRLWISGEVTNLRAQPSGHLYFTLKDAGSQVSCVLFRGDASGSRGWIEDGRKVLLHGEVTIYEPRGLYQLRVLAVELQGVGALQMAFERLKQKLQAEGLFAPEHKRALPRYVFHLGVVTSPTGAALRDVLHVVHRRHPALRITLAPCRVQGQGAAEDVAGAIQTLNEWQQPGAPDRGPDVILVTRGGGSLEDLWAFNEEIVARAIYRSAVPVVSAVGHEIDFTISDFVADLRAATPSAAAEIITEGVFSSREFLAAARERLVARARQCRVRFQERVGLLGGRLVRAHPRNRLNERWQRLDDLQDRLVCLLRFGWRAFQSRWSSVDSRWRRLRPRDAVATRRQETAHLRGRLGELGGRRLVELVNRHAMTLARLQLLSPEHVLARGYSITMDATTGRVLREAAATAPGQVLKTRLQKGEVRSVVSEVIS